MATNKTYKTITILAAGATTILPVTDITDIYDIKASGGTVILVGNVSIASSGTPVVGTTFAFLMGGGFTLGANTFTIFGTALTTAQCLYKQKVLCYYNGSSWDVYIDSDDSDASDDINGADIVALSIPTAAIAANAITLGKLVALSARGYMIRAGINGAIQEFDAKTTGQLVMGNGTDVVSVAMSGDATINGSGVITLSTDAVDTTNITDANVTVAKVSSDLKKDFKTYSVSFETGELGIYKIRCSFPGSITNIYAEAVKAIANTDAGTVILKNNAGTTMTVTTPISFAASDAFGTAYSSAVTANNTFIAGDIITITTAKTTAGGKVLVTLEVLRS